MRGSFVIQDFQTFGCKNRKTNRVTSFWVAKVFIREPVSSGILIALQVKPTSHEV
jgi:hypothetical protein